MLILVVLLLIPRSVGLLHPVLLLSIIPTRVVRLLAKAAAACGQQHATGTSRIAPFIATIGWLEHELLTHVLEQ